MQELARIAGKMILNSASFFLTADDSLTMLKPEGRGPQQLTLVIELRQGFVFMYVSQ